MSGGKGGCRHTAKPFVDVGLLLEALKRQESVLKNFGPYAAISSNQAVDPKGLMHCFYLLEGLVKLSPTAEVHTNPLRQALLKMLGDNPSLNDSRFNGGVWVNLKCERIGIILKHLRKVKGQEEAKNLASKLTAAEFTLLKGLVDKVELKEDDEKGKGNTKRKLKKNDSEISLDSSGYPKCLLSPPKKMLAIEDAKPDTLSKGSGSPALTKGKGGAMPSVPKYLTRNKPGHKYDPPCPKPGHKYDPPCPKDVPLKARMGFEGEKKGKNKVIKKKKKNKSTKGSGVKDKAALKKPAAAPGHPLARKPWDKLRITNAKKPERSYIVGCYKGEPKLKLIVEVSRKRCENYQEIIRWLHCRLEEDSLTKEEIVKLRDDTC